MPVVAVIDTSVEVIEILQTTLEEEGYTVPTAYALDFRRTISDLPLFFQAHHPQVVLYHIALPYVDNWTFFREYVLTPGYVPESCFVVTTTNKRVLEELVGSTYAIELVGRPFDLDLIMAAVQRSLDTYQLTSATAMQQASALSS